MRAAGINCEQARHAWNWQSVRLVHIRRIIIHPSWRTASYLFLEDSVMAMMCQRERFWSQMTRHLQDTDKLSQTENWYWGSVTVSGLSQNRFCRE